MLSSSSIQLSFIPEVLALRRGSSRIDVLRSLSVWVIQGRLSIRPIVLLTQIE